MDVEWLSSICTGLGLVDEDENGAVRGYNKTEYCVDNLKDLQRYLRRDDPQRRDVFKQLCKWSTASMHLVPIIEHHQSDRNLVISAVKVLVFLTMPIDPATDDVAQQIEYLWDLKAAMSRNVVIAVIVSLLEDPLVHLERDAFTEDDWKLVQLVLTLFRNLLAIQDISLQQKASGSATHILFLREKLLELLFQESVMDLILVLTQHLDDSSGYLRQDNLLFLEIFYYTFLGQDPELVARACRKSNQVNEDITASVDTLKSMMEQEKKKKIGRLRKSERDSQFSGTFARITMDGSRAICKGNSVRTSGDGFLPVHKVQRGPLKRIAWDYGSASFPKEDIMELLHNFASHLISGGYNSKCEKENHVDYFLEMLSVFNDVIKEHEAIQNADVIIFFWVAQFVIAFHHQKVSRLKKTELESTISEAVSCHRIVDDISFNGGLCGPIAATINEAMFSLVMSKWREVFEGLEQTNDLKSLTTAGSLMKSMIRMLDLVLKLLPEDSAEPQTARILLYKIFYDQTEQGPTQFILNLFKAFDVHKQPRSYLADLLETIHVVLRLMEKLQNRGTLRVSRKSRTRGKEKITEGTNAVKGAHLGDEHVHPQKGDDQTNVNGILASELSKDLEELDRDDQKEPSNDRELHKLIPGPTTEPGVPPIHSVKINDVSPPTDSEKASDNPIDTVCETEISSDDPAPATYEVDFNVTKLVAGFANNTVIHNLCWLLKFYKSNSACINHYIICLLRRFCDDLQLSPMLYQLSMLITFYEILADQKASRSKEYGDIVHFLSKFVRQMLKMLKKQPLLFVEILFWKTRKECHNINADALDCDLVKLKKELNDMNDDEDDHLIPRDLDDERLGNSFDQVLQKDSQITNRRGNCEVSPTSKSNNGIDNDIERKDQAQSSHSAKALDPDRKKSPAQVSNKYSHRGPKNPSRKKVATAGDHFPVLNDVKFTSNATSSGSNELQSRTFPEPSVHTKKRRVGAFGQEQEHQLKLLFERFKDHYKCNHMIADALEGDNKYTAAQVSRKLKQLNLTIPRKRRPSEPVEISCDGQETDDETLLAFKQRRKRKKNQSSTNDPAMEISPHNPAEQDNGFNDGGSSSMPKRSATLDTSLEDELDVVDIQILDEDLATIPGDQSELQGVQKPDDELEDLLDSGDDTDQLQHRRIGSRRSLQLVIDVEDEE